MVGWSTVAANPKVSPINSALAIEWWDVDRPKDYPLNARKWKPEAVAKVAMSLETYGWRQPIVVDKAEVIVIGHLRRAAARQAGMRRVPVHVAADLSPEEIRGLRLADNRTHDEAEWDTELLAREFGELKALDFDLGSTAFSLREIDSLTLKPDPNEDDVPPVPEVPVTKPGDLWVMGAHRLLCGDATRAEDVERVLGDVKPFLMVTDPPYGVDYDPTWRSSLDQWNQATNAFTDTQCLWPLAIERFPGDVVYLWHAGSKAAETAAELLSAGFEVRAQIVWRKPHFVISRGHYHSQHEPCWYAVRKGKQARWNGARDQSTVWDVANRTFQGGKAEAEDERTGHGTQKPVELMRRPMQNHESEVVYDPFLGSGTTVIAAESKGRRCYGLEIEPAYCDVIVKRWENLTGKTATLDETHQTFAQVAQCPR